MSDGGEQVAQKTQTKQGEHTEERSFERRPVNTTKLQIKALPYNTTKDDLTELCRRYGQITAVEAKGTMGFVTFFKADEAQLAIHKLDGTAYRGFTLRVAYAKEPFPTKKPEDANKTTTTTTTTTTTSTKATEVKPAAEPENKPRFAQQQKIVQKPKVSTSFNQPKEQPKAEEPKAETQPQQQQQQQGKGKKGKGKQQQQQQQGKGAQNQPAVAKEVRTYKVTVEKIIVSAGDTKQEEGFTFSVSHQQYLDHIIPLLKDIQAQKEKEKEKTENK
jgi:RNA recognition motif-containing protein